MQLLRLISTVKVPSGKNDGLYSCLCKYSYQMTSESLVSRPFSGKVCLARHKGMWSRVEVRTESLTLIFLKKLFWTLKVIRVLYCWPDSLRSYFFGTHSLMLLLFSDHQHLRQQSDRDPLHWLGCPSDCRGHWSPRDPTSFPQKLYHHPTTGQLFGCTSIFNQSNGWRSILSSAHWFEAPVYTYIFFILFKRYT